MAIEHLVHKLLTRISRFFAKIPALLEISALKEHSLVSSKMKNQLSLLRAINCYIIITLYILLTVNIS